MTDSNQIPQGIFHYPTQTHFDDLDGLWVLHHSKYLVFLEHAVMALFYQAMKTEVFDRENFPDLYQVVRNVNIHYIQPIDGVYGFSILLAVERLREAGLTFCFAFTSPDFETVYARGVRTCCKLGKLTHTPSGWSPQFRTAYEKLASDAQKLDPCWVKILKGS